MSLRSLGADGRSPPLSCLELPLFLGVLSVCGASGWHEFLCGYIGLAARSSQSKVHPPSFDVSGLSLAVRRFAALFHGDSLEIRISRHGQPRLGTTGSFRSSFSSGRDLLPRQMWPNLHPPRSLTSSVEPYYSYAPLWQITVAATLL